MQHCCTPVPPVLRHLLCCTVCGLMWSVGGLLLVFLCVVSRGHACVACMLVVIMCLC